MYEGNLPYTKPQSQTPTPQTPNVDGWRAPDQPEKVSNLQPQIYRNFDLENIYWGLQTVITPLMEKVVENQSIKFREVSFEIPTNPTTLNPVTKGRFIAPTQPEGQPGVLLKIENLNTETSCFNVIIRATQTPAHPFNNRDIFSYAGKNTKLQLAFYSSDNFSNVDYRYNIGSDASGILGPNQCPVSTIELDWIDTGIEAGANTAGYWKGSIQNPIHLLAVSGDIYCGVIAATNMTNALAGYTIKISAGFL